MLIFTRIVPGSRSQDGMADLVLDHEQRRRCRLITELVDGTQVGIALWRGTVLRNGDILATDLGQWSMVKAASEQLSVVTSTDWFELVRAAYYLGNRHATLQIETGSLCYPHDPLLDKLCSDLGLKVSHKDRPFEPEKLGQPGHVHSSAHSPSDSPSHDAQRAIFKS